MKKLILILCGIIFSVPCYADTISLHTVTADNAITAVNDNFTNIANRLNGDIDGSTDGGITVSNIQADSVYEINMADDTNPRLRDSELFNITTDTISGGAVSAQGTVVESGCVQATDTDLTADVSACTAYINGYRVVKSATAQTYADATTTYLWLSQTGVYTQSTNPNTTVANSSLLASVVTSGGQITTVTNLFTTRVPGLVIPSHYRTGMIVSRESTTVLAVLPGTVEVNSSMLSKTAKTQLTISTAGDWAGGSSLQAASTFGFVGIDTSGNLKLHTTAPTHDNYAVSTTAGKKRYATWSSTVYRILGWFYMDSASGGLMEVASNIKEGDVANTVTSNDTNIVAYTSTTYLPLSRIRFYSSGNPVRFHAIVSGDTSATINKFETIFVDGSSNITNSEKGDYFGTGGSGLDTQSSNYYQQSGLETPSQATRTYLWQGKVSSDTFNRRYSHFYVEEA